MSNWKALVTHFKIFHLLKSDSAYKCCEGKGALLPLKLQLKKYFEHGDNLKIQMNEIQKLQLNNDGNISNFIQRNLW